MTLFVDKPAPLRRRKPESLSRAHQDQTRACVIVLAKTPKGMGPQTRLARDIGAPDAALVYHRLLERTLRHLERGEVSPVVAVPSRASEFRTLATRKGAHVSGQARGDLGRRIAAAVSKHAGPCVVVDSDAPNIDALLVRHAAQALGVFDLIIGPTWNGGYYLVGLRAPAYAFGLFKDVRWNTSRVLDDTLENVPKHWRVGLLPVLADANDPALMDEVAADYAPPRRRSSSLGIISTRQPSKG